MNDVKKIVQSVSYATQGLRHAYALDKSFRLEINYGLPLYLFVAWLLSPLLPWELILYTFSYLLILIVELVNTAFEKMLERVHPDHHELIGKSKDISSASVLVAFLFALIVVFVLAYGRIPYFHGDPVWSMIV